MDYKIFKSFEIDPEVWDEFVRSSSHGSVYALYQSLEILDNGWEAVVFYKGDTWQAVFPFRVKKKFWLKYCFQPMFTQYLGLIERPHTGKTVVYHDWTKELNTNLSSIMGAKFDLFSCNFSPQHKFFMPWVHAGFTINPRVSYHLNIQRPVEDIFSEIAESTRRNIKKAKEIFSELNKKITPTEVIQLFKEVKGEELLNIKPDQYKAYQKWLEYLDSIGALHIIGHKNQSGEVLGAKILIQHNDHMIYSLGAVREEAKQSNLSPLLLWEGIQLASNYKCHTFDFEGSMIAGVERFFRSFGGEPVVYNNISKKPFWWL